MKNFKFSNVLLWIGVVYLFVSIYDFYSGGKLSGQIRGSQFTISDFNKALDEGRLQSVTVTPMYIKGQLKDGTRFKADVIPYYTTNILERLEKTDVKTDVVVDTRGFLAKFFGVMISWFPMLLFIGIWIYFSKKSSGGAGGSPSKLFGFGKSKAKMILPKDIKTRFKDVAGIDEAKEELMEVVDFLKDGKKYFKLGAKIPKGCLLHGSPGTGKTLVARAIAGEAGVPFFHISGSDFVEMFVGVGASRVREMFAEAKQNSPCIVFIDEIDAVGRQRGSGVGGGNDEREQTLNQLLVEMDGFDERTNVVIIAATNRIDVLDKALLRPGRFDRQIAIGKPDIKGREEILKVHSSKVRVAPDVNIKALAKSTPGFSGADLANLVNEAALLAARDNKLLINMKDFENAKDRILMGMERKSMIMKDEEKRLTAYHEGGHAIVALNSKGSDPIHKATIVPRGRALGVVMRFPEEDSFSMTRQKMLADLAVAMGGRAAEELIFGHEMVTSGAMSDIRQATALASAMVKEWGMSDEVGPIYHGSENPYRKDNMESEEVTKTVDLEIKKFVEYGLNEAKRILNEKRNDLETIAQALLKYETLSGQEIKDLLDGKPIEKYDVDSGEEVQETSKTLKGGVAHILKRDDAEK
jgi:cell division protease FtsH